MDFIFRCATPLGGVTLASDGEALTGLWFDGQKYFGSTLGARYEERSLPVFHDTERWLDIYFSGRDPGFVPALSLRGTPFRRAVWECLLTIPYGHTVTYGALAAALPAQSGCGRTSARAIGGAVGRNPVSLIVPCHRVTGAGGSLTGYAGGVERKAALLLLEHSAPPSSFPGMVR